MAGVVVGMGTIRMVRPGGGGGGGGGLTASCWSL